ncbi:MAG: DUF2652 domain-containing protein [Anaerolineales bacterium]|nr:MAG: DUF2652 domain-containing protein [Anaerolineales bacterium]
MSKTFEGYLLIADITGYTSYLSESELEHAQDTLTTLLKVLVEHTRPPLVISRLAGDAVISYGLRENFFQSQTFLEVIEDTYVAFRKAIELMVLNNTCRCNACANVSSLDLKFFLHYGSFAIQRIAEHDELVGSDVNLLHRLLKNRVMEITGRRAYILFTEPALQRLGISALNETMTPHSESYEHLGEVKVWVQDMHPVWQNKRQAATINIPEKEISWQSEFEIAMSPEQLWDYVTQPEFRNTLIGADRMELANRVQGRVAAGSIYQCYHGNQLVPHTILEWQPFERMLTQEVFPLMTANSYLREYHLEATEGGTQLTVTVSKGSGPALGRILMRLVMTMTSQMINRNLTALKAQIETDYRKRQEGLQSDLQLNADQIREAAAASLEDLPAPSSSP